MKWRSDYRLPFSRFIIFFVLIFFLIGEQLPALSPYVFGPHKGDATHILARAPKDALHRPIAYLIIASICWLFLKFLFWPIVWVITGILWEIDQWFLTPERPSIIGPGWLGVILTTTGIFLFWGILTLCPYFLFRWIDKKWGSRGTWKTMLILFLINLGLFIFMAYQILVLHRVFGLNPNGSQGGSLNDQRNIVCQKGSPNNPPDCPKSLQVKINPYLGVPCTSNPKPQFTHDLTETDKITKITPPSLLASKNQDRAFLWIDTAKVDKVPIYAPVEADLVRGVYKISKSIETIDYDLHFQVSCNVWFFINHISDPTEKIKKVFPKEPATATNNLTQVSPQLHFKAGEIIGYTKGTAQAHNFDFAVFDLNHTNGLIGRGGSNDPRFKNFICPFDLFPESLKSEYYKKLDPSLISESNCK